MAFNSKTSAGGAAIYVSDKLNYRVKKNLKLNVDDCESIFIEIYSGVDNGVPKKITARNTFLLGCIYRHPRWSTASFVDKLYTCLNAYTEKNIPIAFLGDININFLEKTAERSLNYINTLSSMGCKNLIDIPTCFTNTSRSCLDHIVTNSNIDNIAHGVLDFSPTNHLPIYAIFKGNADPYLRIDKRNNVKWRFIRGGG